MSIILPDSIKHKLLDYQISHAINLIHILGKNGAVLDSSDTGVGKTYACAAVCAYMKYHPIVVCPRSVISTWKSVMKRFDVTPAFIVNHETLKFGKYYDATGKRIRCPYIKIIDKDSNKQTYEWILDNKHKYVIVFDEAHRCQNFNSLNGQLMYSAKQTQCPMMMLSATIADQYEKFRILFYCLNFISPEEVARQKLSYERYQYIVSNWLARDSNPLQRIHNMLYPDRASRIRIESLGDKFPDTQIIAQPYTLEPKRARDIENAYREISKLLDDLKAKTATDKANILVKILRAHQRIEILKVPIFVELAHDFIESGYSVVIFVNYSDTLRLLAEMLQTVCLIHGQQTNEQRERNIKSFQDNESRIIISNIKAGGIGISLNDVHGGHPRASLISPSWSSVELVQALGRVHRAGGKSKSIQRIIYVDNTIETHIADKLQAKLKAIGTINDGDLDLTGIHFERERITA